MSLTLDDVLFKPRSRSFVVGTTGTGKSTLSADFLNEYMRKHRNHYVYLLDPKKRFVAVEPEDLEDPMSSELFPHGSREFLYGRRTSVPVTSVYLEKIGPHMDSGETRFIVQDDVSHSHLMDWLYDNADVRRPSLLYLDESFDMMSGTRANPSLRRLLQQGREIGVGILVINQRPSWIDRTILTESDNLYVGTLDHEDDRKAITRIAPQGTHSKLEKAFPLHTWFHIDKRYPIRSRLFKHVVERGA